MRPLEEKSTMTEHEKKYDKIAQRIGIEALKKCLPFSAKSVKRALEAGDEHLNTIPLPSWDKAAGNRPSSYPLHKEGVFLSWDEPWTKDKARGLSLAERVYILKHVAKFYLVATLLFLGGCGADIFDCNDCYDQDYYEAHTYECEECLLEMLERGEG